MSAVYKTDIIFFIAKLFEYFLLNLAVIPDKAKIAANNKRIALFEPL